MNTFARIGTFALLLSASGCGAGKIVGTVLGETGVVDKNTARAIGASDNLTNAMKPIGFEEEKAIGGAVALMAVSRFGGLDPDEKAQRYVATVGNAVAAYSDRAAIPYYFAVLSAKEPNAFACPGGYIFVTRGLLDLVDDEAELAGVLGHEIAHVSEKHALSIVRRSKMIAGTAEVSAAYLDANPDVFDKLVNETAKTIFEKGMDKDKELDSDRIGTDYAHRLGYDAAGLKDFLRKLDRHTATTATTAGDGKKKDMKSTHPASKERIEALDRVIKKSYKVAGGPRLADRYRQRMTR